MASCLSADRVVDCVNSFAVEEESPVLWGLWMKDSFRMFAPLAAAAWPLVSPGKNIIKHKKKETNLKNYPIWRVVLISSIES